VCLSGLRKRPVRAQSCRGLSPLPRTKNNLPRSDPGHGNTATCCILTKERWPYDLFLRRKLLSRHDFCLWEHYAASSQRSIPARAMSPNHTDYVKDLLTYDHFSVSDHRQSNSKFVFPRLHCSDMCQVSVLARSSKFSLKSRMEPWECGCMRIYEDSVERTACISQRSRHCTGKITMLRCSTGPEVESDSTVVWPRLGSWLSYGTDCFQLGFGSQVANVPRVGRTTSYFS
jgi:hypothetical protein